MPVVSDDDMRNMVLESVGQIITEAIKMELSRRPPPAPPADLRTLELIGDALRMGATPTTALKHARATFNDDTLIALTEDDDSSENVLRAATYLLEMT